MGCASSKTTTVLALGANGQPSPSTTTNNNKRASQPTVTAAIIKESKPAPPPKPTKNLFLSDFLPETLLDANNDVVDTSVLCGKVVALYFNSHCCPPCREFTPKLIKWFTRFQKNHKRSSELAVVFVGADQTEESYDFFRLDMNFHALPFESQEHKNKLKAQFSVRGGTPAVVFVDSKGNTISVDGCDIVEDDENGDDFPWTPIPVHELIGAKLIGPTGAHVDGASLKGKYLGLYFSAQWCGPCRGFKPRLVKMYNSLKAKGKPFEVIFVSADTDEDAFAEFASTMPWLSIAFEGTDKQRATLTSHYKVKSIPTLILLDPELRVISDNGRMIVEGDMAGDTFPWAKQAMYPLNDEVTPMLSEMPFVLVVTDGSDEEVSAAKAALDSAAEAELAKKDPKLWFFYVDDPDDDVFMSIAKVAKIKPSERILILDMTYKKKFVAASVDITNTNINAFVKAFLFGKLLGGAKKATKKESKPHLEMVCDGDTCFFPTMESPATKVAQSKPASNADTSTVEDEASTLDDAVNADIADDMNTIKLIGGFLPSHILNPAHALVPSSSLTGKVIGLYFSAKWCAPCRLVTPQLIKWFSDFKKYHPAASKLELLYISSDHDQSSFDDYYKDMTGFHALPFAERGLKARIAASLGVRGIPMLVFVDESGSVISREGVKLIESDPFAKGFPWTPKPFVDMLGHSFIDSRGEAYTHGDLLGKYVLIYFSAHWCNPCRKFTPNLIQLYNDMRDQGKELEVIFVSSDRDEESFNFYFSNMPWLTLGRYTDAGVRTRSHELTEFFNIKSVPSLVILDPDLRVVNYDGRRAIEADLLGESFPWYPKIYEVLDENCIASINQMPFLLVITDGSPVRITQAITAITPAAAAEKAKLKPKLRFFYLEDPDEEVFASITKSAKLPDDAVLVIIDMAYSKLYIAPKQDVTPSNVSRFVARYLRGTLPSRSFRRQSMHVMK